MKKYSFAQRGLTLLLAILMVTQLLPLGVLAVTGDIVVGDTGIVNSSLGDEGTINWPIKIYDYLNDGMLFEPATANRTTGDTSSDSVLGGWYGLYGGGQNMPETVQGTDYTGNSAYLTGGSGTNYYSSLDTTDANYSITKVEAEHYVSPQYMRIEKHATLNGNSMCLINFSIKANARKITLNSTDYFSNCLAYDDVRYMVLVYKSKDMADQDIDLWLESHDVITQDPDTGVLTHNQAWKYVAIDISLQDSTEWKTAVIDLKTVDPALTKTADGSATVWEEWQACSAVYLRMPGMEAGDQLDISHVAFFGTQGEAERYGERAVAFDNAPGECLLKARTITLTEGTPTYYTYPAASAPTWDLSLNHSNTNVPTSSSTTNLYRYGMNFTDGTGQGTQTYANWSSGDTLTLTSSSSTTVVDPSDMTVVNTDDGNRDHVTLSNSNSSTSNIILSEFVENDVTGTTLNAWGSWRARYLVLVYRTEGYSTSDQLKFWLAGYTDTTSGCNGSAWLASYPDGGAAKNIELATYGTTLVQDGWVSTVVDMQTLSTNVYVKYVGMNFPTGSGKALDLAYVGYFSDPTEASTFGTNAVAYMNQGIQVQTGTSAGQTVTFPAGRSWNSGNNLSFGLYHGSQGGEWTDGANGGLNSHASNGYYSYRIGYDTTSSSTANSNQKRKPFGLDEELLDAYYTASDSNAPVVPTTGKTNQIFYTTAASNDGNTNAGYSTSHLPLDGYSLYTTLTSGGMTVGLLEGTTKDGRPVYRQETVEYVAELLYDTLTIPQFDATGNYNYNFVSGTASDQFATDLNGDGDMVDMIDTNGDQVPETSEAAMDLASALRYELGVKFTLQSDRGTAPTYGDYATTSGKALLGSFESCRGSIDTCMDAAWFLLNNLFVDGSYNQLQDDFSYLTLSYATMDETDENGNSKSAYVFDAGYATAVDGYTEGTQISYLDADQYTSTSAVDYNNYGKTDDAGNVIGDGTISLMNDQVGSKDLWCYLNESKTTRFPFLPVVDAEDEYAAELRSPYFRDDGSQSVAADKATYVDRNYNYVMASNGEFVYYEEDDLFFEFEGDDDVYLFINGHLVLDIGGAHSITAAKLNVNDYVDWARGIQGDAEAYAALSTEEKARVDALALTEGQVCQFDFYYMERHGYGANCRIVTNMHVTDPALTVDKTAHQGNETVEYGGVVDPATPIGYEFKLTNAGNTKLYNLTFSDAVIGVTLDPQNGLTIDSALDGYHVMDESGQSLTCTDLSAVVEGYNAEGEYQTQTVTFDSEQALKNFLATLDAEGLEDGEDDSEVTRSGSGLWVGSSVTIKGIYYKMTTAQVKAGLLANTVEVVATTKIDPADAANQTRRSSDTHRVYTAGAPVYYQWAGHPLFLTYQELLEDATQEAGIDSSQLSQYRDFFNTVGKDLSKIHIRLADKDGKAATYSEVKEKTYSGAAGYEINYPTPDTKTFFVVMHLTDYAAGTAISAMEKDEYAIIRVAVYVTDVQDSVFVLDYGLRTESLDVDGELFGNDFLYGSAGGMQAKLMGVSTTEPSYLSAASYGADRYNRIAFEKYALGDDKKITFEDGYFKLNLAIGEQGKEITYDAANGHYSLTEVGTVGLNVEVPSSWGSAYVYYWYGGGRDNVWPGDKMTLQTGSTYYLDIPADVSNVVISNGAADEAALKQTDNLTITPGVESTITVSEGTDGTISASIVNVAKFTTVHVTSLPDDWGTPSLHAWRDDGTQGETGFDVEMTQSGGVWTGQLSSEASYLIVTNGGNGKQSIDLDIYAGQEVWIALDSEMDHYNENGDACYNATLSYNQSSYTVHAKVPSSWSAAYLYCWYTGIDSKPADWPGQAMTKEADGWYSLTIPAGISYMVINGGPDSEGNVYDKTIDLTVNAGLETWITVDNNWSGKDGDQNVYGAKVAYSKDGDGAGFTYVPTDFMESTYSIWLGLTVHTTGLDKDDETTEEKEGLSPLMSADTAGIIDINNEVQMYKKVTVLPANVVYYEDDFDGIQYAEGVDSAFTHHGEGSGSLTQEVRQDQPYGQDDAYQSGANTDYSGNSLTQYEISTKTNIANFSFTFAGTGFELIGKTNALDAATITVKVFSTKVEDGKVVKDGDAIHHLPVINEFDNGNDGGNEAISQVPIVRVRDLSYGTYIVEVSGSPTYDFDSWDGSSLDTLKVKPTQMYVDGLRIFQPLGSTHEHYAETEDGASFLEVRDQIAGGLVAVADLVNGSLSLSSGTMTWTEDLLGDDHDEQSDVFVGNQVDSTDDYLIQGPNNEVYMEGSVSNSALVFYVKEQAAAVSHELQLAVRGLDYERFYGVGNSPLSAQLQYGVELSDGSYAWKPLVTVKTGTEQYYSIPYTQCPKDGEGRYQIVIRAVDPNEGDLSMVSYSTMKLVGLDLEQVDGVGEATLLYYKNGVLVRPEYYLCTGTEQYTFSGGTLKVRFEEDTQVYVMRETDTTLDPEDQVEDDATFTDYRASADTTEAAVTLVKDGTGTMTVPGGVDITFQLSQTVEGSVDLSYCAHAWDQGEVQTAATCTADGITKNTCTACGEVRYVTVPATGHTMDGTGTYCVSCGYGCTHQWTDGTCGTCGQICAHNWSDGVCTICQMVCDHTYGEDSICTECGDGCGHSWTDGTCTACQLVCGHSWNVDSCTVCGKDRGLYLFGYINGANYACEEDSGNIGIYQFQDGTLTATFTQASYVAVKTGDNAGWYMTNGYPGTGTTSTVLYNTGAGIDANKLYVPGGVEVTITAQVGTDDTLTLSYTVDTSTCTHMDHYTNGLCIACGADVGHSYTNGYCIGCGRAYTTEYYLFGYINGANYACEEDYQSMGIYRFVDGKLTVTFDQPSYVAVKTSNNEAWYMTNGWLGESVTSATLYNTNSGIDANKLYVPGNKQITFYLTVNGDGTLTLSYTASTPALSLVSIADQMASTVLVGAANEQVSVPEVDTVTQPTLTLDHPSLSFEDEVLYNVYYTAADVEDVVEMGLITFGSNLPEGTMAEAVDVLPGYVSSGTWFMAQTEGIPAARMGDTVYFKVYAELTDGSYVYSEVGGYNAKAYAQQILADETSTDAMKALVVAMLNYGAEAQLFFGYDTEDLMNSVLTDAQKALVAGYDEGMIDPVCYADTAKSGMFVRENSNFKALYPSVSFDGAFSINYYCTPAITVDDGMTLYWWDAEAYDAITEFTVDNATGSKVMTESDGQYWANVSGIAAKEIDKTYYVSCVFQSEGETVTTGIISYSLGKYCEGKAATDGDAQQAFAQATAVYGYYAKQYFASIA